MQSQTVAASQLWNKLPHVPHQLNLFTAHQGRKLCSKKWGYGTPYSKKWRVRVPPESYAYAAHCSSLSSCSESDPIVLLSTSLTVFSNLGLKSINRFSLSLFLLSFSFSFLRTDLSCGIVIARSFKLCGNHKRRSSANFGGQKVSK